MRSSLGAQSIDPRFKTKVYWTGSWFAREKEAKAARDAAADGIDIITQQNGFDRAHAGGRDQQSARFRLWQRPEPHRSARAADGNRLHWGAYDTARVKAYLDGSWAGEVNWEGSPPESSPWRLTATCRPIFSSSPSRASRRLQAAC